MNRFLRTASSSRLLGAVAGLLAVIGAGAAIALAAQGGGPVPPRKPLAAAIRQALSAPAPTGISGSISLTNNLVSSSQIQGSDPLLSGGSGRFWVTRNALRLELQGGNGDANVVVRNGFFWAYDPTSNTVYEGRLPSFVALGNGSVRRERRARREAIPTVGEIEKTLSRLAMHLRISGAIPTDVGGRPTYTVRVSPRGGGGLLGAAELAWDATRGVPLRVALYARGDSTPVVSVQATAISYGSVSSAVFSISPPSGARVVRVSLPSWQRAARTEGATSAHHRPITGLVAVSRRLTFSLAAPPSLSGLRRSAVTMIGADGALVLYGRPLGGVAVIEQVARPGASGQLSLRPAGGDQPGLTLPTISIGTVRAQELDTALGSVVRFARGRVQYTVLGSVKRSVVVAAARELWARSQ